MLAEDGDGGNHLGARPGAGLELVCLGRTGERFLPTTEPGESGYRADPRGGEVFAVAALSRLRLHLLDQRKHVGVVLGPLEQDSQVAGRPYPGGGQFCCSRAGERSFEQDARLDHARLVDQDDGSAGECLDERFLELEVLGEPERALQRGRGGLDLAAQHLDAAELGERRCQLAARSGLVERRERCLQPRSRFVEVSLPEVDVGEGDPDPGGRGRVPLAFVERESPVRAAVVPGRVTRLIGERAGPREQLGLQRRLLGGKDGRLVEVVLCLLGSGQSAARSAACTSAALARTRISSASGSSGAASAAASRCAAITSGTSCSTPAKLWSSAATAARWRALRSRRESVS